MAKFLSQVYTAIRGSVGGITYLTTPYGSLIARARVHGVQPNTQYQVRMRAALNAAVQAWPLVAPGVRDGWDAYAASIPQGEGIQGYPVTGRNIMVGNYSLALYLDNRSIVNLGVVAPSNPTILGLLALEDPLVEAPVAAGTGFNLNVLNPSLQEDVFLIASRSAKVSDAKNFFKGPFDASTLAGSAFAIGGARADIDFLGLEVNAKYFVQFRLITKVAPYRISPMYILPVTAQTTP